MIDHKITVGLSVTKNKEETIGKTLHSSGNSGSLDYLLSTPEILDIIIDVSSKMLDPLLPSTHLTVGKHIELSHEQPTLKLLGGCITTKMIVTEIIKNKVLLDFSCYDEIGLICKGKYERDIVEKDKLMESTYRRAQSKM